MQNPGRFTRVLRVRAQAQVGLQYGHDDLQPNARLELLTRGDESQDLASVYLMLADRVGDFTCEHDLGIHGADSDRSTSIPWTEACVDPVSYGATS